MTAPRSNSDCDRSVCSSPSAIVTGSRPTDSCRATGRSCANSRYAAAYDASTCPAAPSAGVSNCPIHAAITPAASESITHCAEAAANVSPLSCTLPAITSVSPAKPGGSSAPGTPVRRPEEKAGASR